MAGAGGPHSANPHNNLSRSLDRILADAQDTCVLKLSGRKLKDFPKGASKYNLSDTVIADLSKNKLTDVPCEITSYISLEKLNLYQNVIKVLHETVISLQQLTNLNLSRNQLSVLPGCVCHLQSLRVLDVSGNRLVSLPEELGALHNLMDLDASYNQLAHLPPALGDLDNLRRLNLRRNLLQTLPTEICFLHLVWLDLSGNRISSLPTELRFMSSLVNISLDNNPLTHPPASLCTRGKVHIFKWLEMTAAKEDKKRGVLSEVEFRKLRKHASSDQYRFVNGYINPQHKRCTMDSGYNTSENGDQRWSHESQESLEYEDPRKLALRAAEYSREQRRSGGGPSVRHSVPNGGAPTTTINGTGQNYGPEHQPQSSGGGSRPASGLSTPSTLSPGDGYNLEDEFNKALKLRQQQDYENIFTNESPSPTKDSGSGAALWNVGECSSSNSNNSAYNNSSSNYNNMANNKLSTSSKYNNNGGLSSPTSHHPLPSPPLPHPHHLPDPGGGGTQPPFPPPKTLSLSHSNPSLTHHHASHIPTYREYLEAKKQQRQNENNNVYRRQDNEVSPTAENGSSSTTTTTHKSLENLTHHRSEIPSYTRPNPAGQSKAPINGEPFSHLPRAPCHLRELPIPTRPPSNHLSHHLDTCPREDLTRLDVKTIQKEAVLSYVKSRVSPSKGSAPNSPDASFDIGDGSSSMQHPSSSHLRPSPHPSLLPQPTHHPPHTPLSSHHHQPHTPQTTHLSYPSSPFNGSGYHYPSGSTSSATPQIGVMFPPNSPQAASTPYHPGMSTPNTSLMYSNNTVHTTPTRANTTSNIPKSSSSSNSTIKTRKRSGGGRPFDPDASPAHLNFTYRRELEKQQHEKQLIENLRHIIESRLKVSLPADLGAALMDGVVLCHLANHVRPRSVSSIHVPSPAVPKLTIAKCRLNVENFMEACRKIGVESDYTCNAQDILEERGTVRVAITVERLLQFYQGRQTPLSPRNQTPV